MTEKPLSPQSWAVQAAHFIDEATGAIVPPINPATTYARDGDYELTGDYIYGRIGAPNDGHVESVIARLECGADARLFASGMAGIVTLFETVERGQHIVAPEVMYYAGRDWLKRIAEKREIGLTLFDARDPEGVAAAVRPGETAIVWVETPVNPTWDVTDIAASAEAAHQAGAILAVDSTSATPAMNPGASVLSADQDPSPRYVSVFAAPIFRAASLTSRAAASAAPLWGSVTFTPSTSLFASVFSAESSVPSGTCIAS